MSSGEIFLVLRSPEKVPAHIFTPYTEETPKFFL